MTHSQEPHYLQNKYTSQVLIIGGGIAGICTAIELLDKGIEVLLLDRDSEEKFGGMANEAFGGMHFVDTPLQRRNGIKDSKQLALDDWLSAAQFEDGVEDYHAKQWAEEYIDRNREDVYEWLMSFGIRFFPVVHWVERGDYGFSNTQAQGGRGNSVPRYHVAWGTGWEVTQTLIKALKTHKNSNKLTLKFNHKVESLTWQGQRVVGCSGTVEQENCAGRFEVVAEKTVVCAGGINGNLEQVKKYWDVETYGDFPENILAGSHPYADGSLHDELDVAGGSVKNLGWMWNYASGVKHPRPEYDNHGLSLIPARSSLWLNARGQRIGPLPLITGFDTHNLCKVSGHEEGQYTWQLMNYKIAVKELGLSSSHINKVFCHKSWLGVIKLALFGNPEMVDDLINHCEDVAVADTLEDLVVKMDEIAFRSPISTSNSTSTSLEAIRINFDALKADVKSYDDQIERGVKWTTDDQIRRLHFLRKWRGDKARTLKNQKINDQAAGPLIAIRTRIISRKSMGGIETDVHSRVLNKSGKVIEGLYAAGEAAGFGGAGCAGKRSLEGTFLSLCILNGRRAGQDIARKLSL